MNEMFLKGLYSPAKTPSISQMDMSEFKDIGKNQNHSTKITLWTWCFSCMSEAQTHNGQRSQDKKTRLLPLSQSSPILSYQRSPLIPAISAAFWVNKVIGTFNSLIKSYHLYFYLLKKISKIYLFAISLIMYPNFIIVISHLRYFCLMKNYYSPVCYKVLL